MHRSVAVLTRSSLMSTIGPLSQPLPDGERGSVVTVRRKGPLSPPLPVGERSFVASDRAAIKVQLLRSCSRGLRLPVRVSAVFLALLGLGVFLVTAWAQP